jgi:hypothetical protein
MRHRTAAEVTAVRDDSSFENLQKCCRVSRRVAGSHGQCRTSGGYDIFVTHTEALPGILWQVCDRSHGVAGSTAVRHGRSGTGEAVPCQPS